MAAVFVVEIAIVAHTHTFGKTLRGEESGWGVENPLCWSQDGWTVLHATG